MVCIERADADALANDPQALAQIDNAQRDRPGPPALVEDRCWKLVYRYGAYRIVIHRAQTGALTLNAGVDEPRTRECLSRAIELVTPLVPYAKTMIARARAKFGDRWDDPDIGAAKYVVCDPPFGADTLLHEINHMLADGACLNDPEGAPICFDDAGDLPPRKIAYVPKLPLSVVEGRGGFEVVQRNYFVASGEQSVVLLHDELLAYAIDADVNAALIGTATKPDKVIALPLIAYLTVHYWELIRRDHRDDFDRLLGANGSMRGAFDRLLAHVERSYVAWHAARAKLPSKVQQQQARGEAKLWQLYVDTKRRLFASP